MSQLVNETKITAYNYLSAFGFEDEQIYKLIEKGVKDINQTVEKLEIQLSNATVVWDEVDDTLHALKGLLFQMGNNEIAEIIDQKRHTDKNQDSINTLLELVQ